MKLVISSDTHTFHEFLSPPAGDVFIHAGDITRKGTLDELRAFNTWLGTLPHTHKLVIAGNHDFCLQKTPNEARAILTNATYLEDETVTIDGLIFHGSPWQPEYHDWAFNLPRGAPLAEKWALIPDKVDVLITHGPPHGILDVIVAGEHVGDRELLEAVKRCTPRLHVFGHIHESQGSQDREGTRFINASFVDFEYDFGNNAWVIDWQELVREQSKQQS